MKILFYFWFFLFLYVKGDDTQCTNYLSPISVKNCSDIKLSSGNSCCYFSYLFKATRYISCYSIKKNSTEIEKFILDTESNDDYDDVSVDCGLKNIQINKLYIIILVIIFL